MFYLSRINAHHFSPFWGMLGAVCLFSFNNALLKYTALSLPAAEIIFFRSLFSLVLMGLFFKKSDWHHLKNSDEKGQQFLRALLSVISIIFMILALKTLKITTFIAIFYTAPLLAAFFASFILKEALSMTVVKGLGLGALGMLFIVSPKGDACIEGLVYAFFSALFYAMTLVWVKKLQNNSPNVLFGWYVLFVLLLTGPTIPLDFVVPRPGDLVFLALMAIVHCGAFMAVSAAFSKAKLSLLAPLEYTGFLWGIVFGYFFFAEIPTLLSMLGAILIVSGGWLVSQTAKR